MSVIGDFARRAACQGAPVLLAGALALSACGSGSTDDAATTDSTDAATPDSTPASTPDLSGDPPGELVVEQLAPPADDQAPEAEAGDLVAVHYTGRSWSTGEVFDSSEGRDPLTFQLGAGEVIPGWDQGIAGLQVGERARLTIPPDLAYGEAGAGGVIGPNETLVFDVELVEILDQPSGDATPRGS